MDYIDMVAAGEREAILIDRVLFPGRGINGLSNQDLNEAAAYRKLKGAFLFFLKNGIKPYDISESDFQSFRPIAEKLVSKGQVKKTVLNLFEMSELNSFIQS
jgi:hypothetical protein